MISNHLLHPCFYNKLLLLLIYLNYYYYYNILTVRFNPKNFITKKQLNWALTKTDQHNFQMILFFTQNF